MSRFLTQLDWDDAPHLTEEAKAEFKKTIPSYLLDARTKGIPQLGSGAVYPIPDEQIEVDDFTIPEFWKKWYGFDVGWKATAAVWFAKNPETAERFIYSIYKQGQEKPIVHASAIKSRGAWQKGAIDPASHGRSQEDGRKLFETYESEGLHLITADNAVESGLYKVWQELASGNLKVFKSCKGWFQEKGLYRRDEKGKIVKLNDHLMDATRYGIMSEEDAADVPINMKKKRVEEFPGQFAMAGQDQGTRWMGNI